MVSITPTPRTSPLLQALRGHWAAANGIQRVAIVLGLSLIALAALAPLIAPFDPVDQSLISRLRPPIGFARYKSGFYLGTDELGRDVLSRCLYGLRLTLSLALAGACIGLLTGASLGLTAGIRRGWVENLVMAAVDIQIAVPFTLIALLILAIFGSSLQVMVLVLGVYGWEQYARIVRAEVRKIAEMPFIEAARAAGASRGHIARNHILPNIVSPLVVQFTLSVSNIVILESTLSFLGLGVQPPTATLGSMVGVGRDYMPTAPWIVIAPAAMILLVTFAVQILGDWMRDRADVRLRER
ncbi:MAG: ABC transporter permease [Confluentimicrobium sp.]|jgi:peptide/nickel transport system permease protein|uniref:Peptide/nickel transport system permease protein n=1 Tax=Actibacterium naphthalenivorans TaxID=1614693 RepID=A0A840C8L2_9RHOB|nr:MULTISPECIES: ABC transporter permease [Actibacterium]ALG89034.1 ABC transporter permease [Actibacterium sp. EMB200-NS6]MBB4021410.1 peptide/nickel transport system permease protein [Actibacterium naphthalenivorans]MBC56869.1 ABC transporter permease [Actibacterium sp.]MDY6858727.1 ABC transporter permease [Pseudomonadota bacterium]